MTLDLGLRWYHNSLFLRVDYKSDSNSTNTAVKRILPSASGVPDSMSSPAMANLLEFLVTKCCIKQVLIKLQCKFITQQTASLNSKSSWILLESFLQVEILLKYLKWK